MFSIGFLELFVLFSIILIVLGPEKLFHLAKETARLIHQLRAVKDDIGQKLSFPEENAASSQVPAGSNQEKQKSNKAAAKLEEESDSKPALSSQK